MLRRNTDVIKDTDTRLAIEHILQEGMGKAIALSAAPSATVPLLDADEIGIYANKIYIRKNQTIYRLDPGAVITIT